MNYTLLLTTEYFMDEVSQRELSSFDLNFNVLDEGFYSINYSNKDELIKQVLHLLYYSRTLTNIYLKIGEYTQRGDLISLENVFNEVKNKELGITVADDEVSSNLLSKIQTSLLDKYSFTKGEDLHFQVFDEEENGFIVVLDLLGFDLTKRSYKLREFEDSLNPLVSSYLFYLLGLDADDKLSFLDPYAQLGDLAIESSLFNPRIPLFVKEKRSIILGKLFTLPLGIPAKVQQTSKISAVIEGDDTFKFFKENLVYAGTKIKVTQFDFDWLDVKYHKGDMDYIFVQFPYFESKEEQKEFEDPFFYQAEFVAKKKIGVITESEINKDILEKYNLTILEKKEIEMGAQEYLIYVIKHKK